MFRSVKRIPFLRLFAVAKLALVAHRHLQRLDADERRQLAALVRRGPGMSREERAELRSLVGKLEPLTLAYRTADAFSPVALPRRMAGWSPR
jgi:hypothetical protein